MGFTRTRSLGLIGILGGDIKKDITAIGRGFG